MHTLAQQWKELPDAPGIYLFYNHEKELIYVGKATSLRNRVHSYFVGKRTPRPIEELIHEVVDIRYTVTDSVLEAIILEANTIKKYIPKYNIIGKDNKSWNYIGITKDPYPVVKTIRQHEFSQLNDDEKKKHFRDLFGPYPGLNTRAAMKLLQQLFRFSSCTPGQKRPCLYYQMGQCYGVCTGEISAAAYRRIVIKPLTLFLQGKKGQLLERLSREMKTLVKKEAYEEAAAVRDQMEALQRIHDIALLNKSFFEDEWKTIPGTRSFMQRIEGYDISNLGTTGKVGSMVVFAHGFPEKSQYRRFRIRTVVGQSDVDCLEEVLLRRFRHTEWPFPDAILIDGGLPQVNRAKKVLEDMKIAIPIVGIAKGPERKRNDFHIGTPQDRTFIRWVAEHQKTLVAVRDEAHRFALLYQRKVRGV
ncbi:MAG TPA: GIY-YIG nuclease family protein [Candidatus Kapabacteria bacterium]|nr:GIY-YIG nuclease family protein [Candidatus Kapabacteria bacterium]